jgi:hypothetical protein
MGRPLSKEKRTEKAQRCYYSWMRHEVEKELSIETIDSLVPHEIGSIKLQFDCLVILK